MVNKVSYYDKKKFREIRLFSGDLKGKINTGKYYKDIKLYDNSNFKTNIVISRGIKCEEPWIIATNGDCNKAVKYYSYRFGGIECVFKNQKSNGFNLERISNANLKSFTSMFSIMCFSIIFVTIIGADYCRSQSRYKNNKIETHKKYNGIKRRIVSIFNTGLIIFHRTYYSMINFKLPLHFTFYDI